MHPPIYLLDLKSGIMNLLHIFRVAVRTQQNSLKQAFEVTF